MERHLADVLGREMLTTSQARERIGVAPTHFYRLLDAGRFGDILWTPYGRLLDAAAVEAEVARRRAKETTAASA